MIILNPNMDGCEVWLIKSPIVQYENKVTRIKGDNINDVCKSLMRRLTHYEKVKNQMGNYIEKLFWSDDVYLDVAAFGLAYKDIFDKYDLDVIDIRGKKADMIIPERI